jgi:hypothetical protein
MLQRARIFLIGSLSLSAISTLFVWLSAFCMWAGVYLFSNEPWGAPPFPFWLAGLLSGAAIALSIVCGFMAAIAPPPPTE